MLGRSSPRVNQRARNLENNIDYFYFSRLVSPKGDHGNHKRKTNLLVEVKAKMFYGLEMMARIFLKYEQVKRI